MAPHHFTIVCMNRMSSTVAAIATLLLLAACDDSTQPQPEPTQASDTASGDSTPSTATPTDEAPTQEPDELGKKDPSQTESAQQASGLCNLDQLNVALQQGEGATGTQYYDLTFTNTSGVDCHIKGYPGVSLVAQGSQIGEAAERPKQNAPDEDLAPGETITYTLGLTRASLYGCKVTDAEGFRVYPPEETRSIVLEENGLEGCLGDQPLLKITDAAKL